MTVKATVGCVIEDKGKILLTLRNIEPFKNCWCLPGGHIEFGETPEEAAIREVKEETGLTINNPKFIGYYNEFYKELNWRAVALFFYAKPEGKIKICEKEVKEIRWLDKKEIVNLPLAFGHKKVVEDYLGR